MCSTTSETIAAGVEAFKAATTSADAMVAMSKIYNAIPHGDAFDLDLDSFDPVSPEFKVSAFRQLDAVSRERPQLFDSQESLDLFRNLRMDLDPLRTTALQGYLAFAPFIGGALYLAALAVQWFVPEIFPVTYVALALLFFSPFLFNFFLA